LQKKVKYIILGVALLVLAMCGYTIWHFTGEAIAAATPQKIIPIYCTDDDDDRIALTFDCAWGADDIPQIMDILDNANIKATFFVVGTWVEEHPDAVKLIDSKGHEIANHSWSHKLPSKSSAEQMQTEITKCNEILKGLIDKTPTLYRAPSGDYNNTLLEIVKKDNMTAVQWSADSLDWQDGMTKENIINRITARTKSGSILLFHNDTKYTVQVLPEIIDHLQKEGYKFCTVSELIYKDNFYIDSQGVQRLKKDLNP
ncbi:MAG: polysaccharide deacetylase family protein, partial [Clostridiales bacterium]|nr:polysaccharide deacetylase family protein [Clostridiales bacterium]